MSKGNRLVAWLATAFLILIFSYGMCPQIGGDALSPMNDTSSRLARLEQQAADAKSSADNAWMLTSAALVLMMTGPGLALFYGGLVRKKNVLGTMMQSFGLMARDHCPVGPFELQPLLRILKLVDVTIGL